MPYVFICRHVLTSWSTKDMASSSAAWLSVTVKRGPFMGWKEEGRQGGVERHVWRATLQLNVGFVYSSGLDCMCRYFPLATVCILVYYV